MKPVLKIVALSLTGLIATAGALGAWYIHTKQPQRSGAISMTNLQAPVSVRYDERGVPHIWAENEADLYRTLGIRAHAQDTLAVSGYLAYSFAAAFRTEPALSYVRDKLGPRYLTVFDGV